MRFFSPSIEPFLEEGDCLLDPALHHMEALLVEVAGEEGRHDARGRARNLRGLDNGAVTRGNSSTCG